MTKVDRNQGLATPERRIANPPTDEENARLIRSRMLLLGVPEADVPACARFMIGEIEGGRDAGTDGLVHRYLSQRSSELSAGRVVVASGRTGPRLPQTNVGDGGADRR